MKSRYKLFKEPMRYGEHRYNIKENDPWYFLPHGKWFTGNDRVLCKVERAVPINTQVFEDSGWYLVTRLELLKRGEIRLMNMWSVDMEM